MPWTPPITPVAGTVITSAWAGSSVVNPINWLRAMTGGVDPPGSNLVLLATGPSVTAWGQIPDAALLVPKVNRTAPAYVSFASAAAGLSVFAWINNPGSIADAPVPTTLDWFLMQIRHPNPGVDYRWQLTCALGNQDELYSRNVIAGVAGPWRRVLTSVNFDPLTFDGGTIVRDDVPGDQFQVLATGGHIAFYNEAASALLADFNNGVVTAPRFVSSVAVGTPPFTVTSTTLVTNLNADLLDSHDSAFFATAAALAAEVTARNAAISAAIAAVAAVPSGLIAAFPNAVGIAAGWSRFTSGNGRLLVGAGTVAGQPFVEGASAGSTWAHLHGVSLTAAAVSGGNVQSGGSSTANSADHTHPVSGNTADQTWIPPSFTVVWAQKS